MTTVGPEPPMLPVRILGVILSWAPVWVPALLIWQITSGGLRPALAEQKRLAAERPAVEARHARTTDAFERMSAEREAWDDATFRERVRRLKARADAHGGIVDELPEREVAAEDPASDATPR